MALIIWWAWVALVIAGLADGVIQGHRWISATFGLGLLAATGLVYVCTWWPKVVAGEAGLTVRNPFRTYSVTWADIEGVYLGESVEISCHRGAGRKPKTIYCWALPSSRRARAKAELRAKRPAGRRGPLFGQPASATRGPAAARSSAAVLMAREIAELAERHGVVQPAAEAPAAGISESRDVDGPRGGWAWQPALAFGVPAVAFAVAMLAW